MILFTSNAENITLKHVLTEYTFIRRETQNIVKKGKVKNIAIMWNETQAKASPNKQK